MSLHEVFVIGIDMRRYSSGPARIQLLRQRELDRMLDEAAEKAGVSRASWERIPAGDGEIAMLPADVDLVAMVGRFVTELDDLLTDHNEDHAHGANIRLRVAMHLDVMTKGRLGHAGPALIVLQRLLDSAPARAALEEMPETNLAQIISESLYQKAVVPELGGLRPKQFRKVQVRLPAKGFNQVAYLSVPKYRPNSPTRPPRRAQPSGFPFIPATPKQDPPKRQPDKRPKAPAQPPTVPPAISPAVRDLIKRVRQSLDQGETHRADWLTTLALLESAGQTQVGALRSSDGHKIPDALLTELDAAWSEFSGGAWGFHAQRKRSNGLRLARRRDFWTLSVLIGWRDNEDEVVPRYEVFAKRGDRTVPFYPTLRNPEWEADPEWHDEWLATVMCVHVRLQGWEH